MGEKIINSWDSHWGVGRSLFYPNRQQGHQL